jgi:outer membrane protein OmpA-like peptidoglycan-associated protein
MDSMKTAENRALQLKIESLQNQLEVAKSQPPVFQTKVDTVVKTIEKTVVQTKLDTVLVPKTKTVIVTEGITGIRNARLFFAQGSFTIMKQDLPALESIANTLKANPGVKLFIRGYADKGTGSSITNLNLSERRAEVVRTYLQGIGVPDKQMTVEAYGDTQPVYRNSMDRRVDLELIF